MRRKFVIDSLVIVAPLVVIGVLDMTKTKQAVRRNFPVIGRGRYLLEMIRPEINRYFVESHSDGRPVSGFQIVTKVALGADTCNAARAMMFAIGCIQVPRNRARSWIRE